MNVHAYDKVIPPGKVLLAECGDIGPDYRRPERKILDSKAAARFPVPTEISLEAVTAGWAIAGSCMRWDNGYYAVTWERDGCTYGKRFKSKAAAREYFNWL